MRRERKKRVFFFNFSVFIEDQLIFFSGASIFMPRDLESKRCLNYMILKVVKIKKKYNEKKDNKSAVFGVFFWFL